MRRSKNYNNENEIRLLKILKRLLNSGADDIVLIKVPATKKQHSHVILDKDKNAPTTNPHLEEMAKTELPILIREFIRIVNSINCGEK
jgi:hypothetical protein